MTASVIRCSCCYKHPEERKARGGKYDMDSCTQKPPLTLLPLQLDTKAAKIQPITLNKMGL